MRADRLSIWAAGLAGATAIPLFAITPALASSPATPEPAPSAPTGVVLRQWDARLTVLADPSASGAPTSYLASDGVGHTCSPEPLTPDPKGRLGCNLTGLTDGQTYNVTVTATNAYGTSEPSAVASGTPHSWSTMTLTGDWSSITATVAPSAGSLAPSGLHPTGTVSVQANGSAIGTVTLNNGVATLGYQIPPGATLCADYAGDSAFYPSGGACLTAPPALLATTGSLQVDQNRHYQFALGASGGTGGDTFTGVGALPMGVSLSSAGMASVALGGVAVTPYEASFTYKVTDAAGPFQASATRTVSITVNPGPLGWETAGALPSVLRGRGYRTYVRAASGWGMDTFAIVAGTLPPGLHLGVHSGHQYATIYGYPIRHGTYRFEMRVRDTKGHITYKLFRIYVK